MSDTSADERVAFEAVITAPPYECSIAKLREGDTSTWPGGYRSDAVNLAWNLWQERAALKPKEKIE